MSCGISFYLDETRFNLKMRQISLATWALSFLLVLQLPGSGSSECYWDAHDGTLSNAVGVENCTQSTECVGGCDDFRSKGTPLDWETNTDNFVISAASWKTDRKIDLIEETVLNVTISNISFNRLDIRLRDLTDPPEKGQYCQTIDFDGNQPPTEINIYIAAWHRRRTLIQFIGHGKEQTFFSEFTFLAPSHYTLSNRDKILGDRIFAYIDTTYYEKVRLHVEPLPKGYNVHHYIAQFRQNMSKMKFLVLDEFNLTGESFVRDVWVQTSGASYDFLITPVLANGTNGTATVTAGFQMWKTPVAMFLLVFFSVAIPVSAIFILRRVYIYHRNKAWRNVKVHLLMIYNSTHPSHIKVVEQLALFLKNCNIDVMIDMWGIDKRPDRNPNLWCDESFAKADIVVVVSSPPESCYTGSDRPIHASTQEHAIRLIVENYPRKDTEAKYNKTYVAIELPYSKRAGLPLDARKFKRFVIPDESKKLLNYCHKTDYTDMFDKWKNNQELIQSIDIAISHILKGEPISEPEVVFSEPEDNSELKEVIPTGPRDSSDDDTESDEYDDDGYVLKVQKSDDVNYPTKLEDLNLTGNKSESDSDDEIEPLGRKPSSDCHILMA